MNILIAASTFPPCKDGISEAAAVMARGFLNRGWNVEVATLTTDPPRISTSWQGAAIHEFSFIGPYNAEGENERRRKVWRDYLTSGEWDVIIIHAYVWQFEFSLSHLPVIDARKILVSHGYAALQWPKNPKFPYGIPTLLVSAAKSLLMPLWQRRFDRVVFLSHKSDLMGFYDHWLAKIGRYNGVRVIPNGVDLNVIANDPSGFRARNRIESEVFMLLCVANYSPRKDQGFAARAYRKAEMPNSVLVFIGSELNEHSKHFQEEDERLFGDMEVGSIVWLEKQERAETLNAIAACDAFVLSANHEAQPIALLEAMRDGKPWVARKAGCIDEMPGGLCVKTEKEMTEALNRIAGDKNLRANLGASGRSAVETSYNMDCYTASYCMLVEQLVTDNL